MVEEFVSQHLNGHLIAQFAMTGNDTRTFYELAPLLPLTQWWHALLLVVVVALLIVFVGLLYRRDATALSKPVSLLLMSLRVLAFLGLLIFILGPQKRSETRMVKPSELAVLIDTSLSMGLTDSPASNADNSRRIDPVINLLNTSELLNQLQTDHEVTIYRFGDSAHPEEIVTLEKRTPQLNENPGEVRDSYIAALDQSRNIGQFAVAALIVALLMIAWSIISRLLNLGSAIIGLSLATGCILVVVGVAALGVADIWSNEFDLWTSLGWREAEFSESADPAETNQATSNSSGLQLIDPRRLADWKMELAPRATSTRMGQAIQQIVDKQRGGAAAGIILVTDGRNNAGPPPARAVATAVDANIPIYVLGIGSDQPPRNVQVSDLQAPPRVYPGDKFNIRAMIQSYGMAGESMRVRLSSFDESNPKTATPEDEQVLRLIDDGKPLDVEFEISNQEEGRRRYLVQIIPPPGDLDRRDNQRAATVEILLRKTKVLLIAGGPTRDYQFLRNQLYRDSDIATDVWLQMAKPGADQESDNMLFEFPQSREELDQFDCIVAFDPDWRMLSPEQARWLERWISEKAGGMLVIAGPVFTPEWTRKPRGDESIDLIRQWYPVSFYSQGSGILKYGRFGGEKPFPLQFTREGRTAEYLWLGNNGSESAANWNQFAGVYGYYAVNEPKAGADILANFSDPSTAIDDQLPIYLASHFYGAGRVVFQASGEIWRLRDVDVDFFQRYYLSLIRWVSQGRLLRDSTRGVLLLDKNRCWVGDQVIVRAILRDASDNPLMATSVNAVLSRPGRPTETIELNNLQDAARPGTFLGQFLAHSEGSYQVRLPIPNTPAGQQELTAEARASIPDLEKQRPERNDALLTEIASKTGGSYLVESQGVLQADGLASMISPADQETYLPDTPNERFTKKTMAWLVGWLTLVLAMEWTIRRLHKLA